MTLIQLQTHTLNMASVVIVIILGIHHPSRQPPGQQMIGTRHTHRHSMVSRESLAKFSATAHATTTIPAGPPGPTRGTCTDSLEAR